MAINNKRYGIRGGGEDLDVPNSVGRRFTDQDMKGNVVVFFSPAKHRNISKQAIRSNVYNMSDSFINECADVLNRSAHGGNANAVKNLLMSKEARDAVTVDSNIDAVVDLNRLNHYWKFLIVLNTANNRSFNQSGVAHTIIITGRCDGYGAPLVSRSGGDYDYNPECTLIIESKSVFQSYSMDIYNKSPNSGYKTKSSVGYGHATEVEQVVNDDLYENTVGGMNFNADINDRSNQLDITTSPVNIVGGHGPSAFDRQQHVPGMALKNTLLGVSKTFKDRDRRSVTPVMDLESNINSSVIRDPTLEYPKLIHNIKAKEHSSSIWSHDAFGPAVNDRLQASQLESEWNINTVKILESDDCEYWQGDDQTDISQVSVFETIAQHQIPTMMVEYQIDSINMAIAMTEDSTGIPNIEDDCYSITSPIPNMPLWELKKRYEILRDTLVDGLFTQILEQCGDFLFDCRINLTSTSGLAIRPLSSPLDKKHVREFFPSEFALTTPMIGTRETVESNQRELGGFLKRICSENNDEYSQDEYGSDSAFDDFDDYSDEADVYNRRSSRLDDRRSSRDRYSSPFKM